MSFYEWEISAGGRFLIITIQGYGAKQRRLLGDQ